MMLPCTAAPRVASRRCTDDRGRQRAHLAVRLEVLLPQHRDGPGHRAAGALHRLRRAKFRDKAAACDSPKGLDCRAVEQFVLLSARVPVACVEDAVGGIDLVWGKMLHVTRTALVALRAQADEQAAVQEPEGRPPRLPQPPPPRDARPRSRPKPLRCAARYTRSDTLHTV